MHMQAHGMQILGPPCRRTSEDDTSVVSPPRGPAHRRRSANPQPHSTSTTPGPVSNYFPLYPGGSDTRNPNAPRQRCHEGPRLFRVVNRQLIGAEFPAFVLTRQGQEIESETQLETIRQPVDRLKTAGKDACEKSATPLPPHQLPSIRCHRTTPQHLSLPGSLDQAIRNHSSESSPL